MNNTRSGNMRTEKEEREADALERLPYASTQGDQDAYGDLASDLSRVVLIWLHKHPRYVVACRYASEEHYVALALDRFQQAMMRGQVVCQTYTEMLVALRACLQGAILETLRTSSRPEAISRPASDSREVWDRLQNLLPAERERRVAYLLYHCGLSSQEIVRLCPQEWSDVREITRLQAIILERLSSKGLPPESSVIE